MDRRGLVPFCRSRERCVLSHSRSYKTPGHISSMSGAAGFEDFWKGCADPMTFSGKEMCLRGPKWGVYFQSSEDEK